MGSSSLGIVAQSDLNCQSKPKRKSRLHAFKMSGGRGGNRLHALLEDSDESSDPGPEVSVNLRVNWVRLFRNDGKSLFLGNMGNISKSSQIFMVHQIRKPSKEEFPIRVREPEKRHGQKFWCLGLSLAKTSRNFLGQDQNLRSTVRAGYVAAKLRVSQFRTIPPHQTLAVLLVKQYRRSGTGSFRAENPWTSPI